MSVAARAITAHPEHSAQILLAAGEWAEYAESRGLDPLSLGADDLEVALGADRSLGTRRHRRRGLTALWDARTPRRAGADEIARLRPFGRRAALDRRLTPAERDLVAATTVRDLRRPALRVSAARDLLAIGLLGAGVTGLVQLAGLKRADLSRGRIGTLDGDLDVGDDVLVPADLLESLLEREIGPLRSSDALVPIVGYRHLRWYRRDDRADMLPAAPNYLRPSLARRLCRAGLDIPQRDQRWTAPSWFVGTGSGPFHLPPDLAIALLTRRPASTPVEPRS